MAKLRPNDVGTTNQFVGMNLGTVHHFIELYQEYRLVEISKVVRAE